VDQSTNQAARIVFDEISLPRLEDDRAIVLASRAVLRQ
jgi:hypothetical protein